MNIAFESAALEGATVKLKKEVNHTCPKGRKNNKTAKVLSVYDKEFGCVMTVDDLRGCRHWNIEDLILVSL